MKLITSTTLPTGITKFVAIDKDCHAENVIYTETEGYECWSSYSDSYEPFDLSNAVMFIYE